jgi:hypothetical protein
LKIDELLKCRGEISQHSFGVFGFVSEDESEELLKFELILKI